VSLWNCEICGNMFTPDIILDHIRLMHPDVEIDCDKWPDGEPVVYEDADDFFL
jgi:hypothetical protein